MRQIGRGAYGTLTAADGRSQKLETFADSIAHKALGDTETAQRIIMARDPAVIVFEIVGGEHYGPGASFDIFIPNLNGCPSATPQ